MKSQMKSADRSGARFVLIVGSDELEAGTVTVREMAGDRTQHVLPRSEIIERVRTLLARSTA
jgi:histidyl-tRNA synthetase